MAKIKVHEIAKELESLRDNTPTTPFNEIKEVINDSGETFIAKKVFTFVNS